MPHAVIVEDDAALGELFATVLNMAGFETTWVADSRQALATIRAQQPALLTLDLHMPHVSGPEILRQVRADAALKHIKVIVVSASALAVQYEDIESLADIVLLKPVSFSQLIGLSSRLAPLSGDKPTPTP